MDYSDTELVAAVLRAGGDVEISSDNIEISLTFEDLIEYKKYRDVGLAVKEVRPSVTILGPIEWYRKYKPAKISKK